MDLGLWMVGVHELGRSIAGPLGGCHLGLINGYPPKWMVYFMENPIKMNDLGGFPPIFGNTNLYPFTPWEFNSEFSPENRPNPKRKGE